MIYYDEALPKFAAVVQAAVGEGDFLKHLFLRDASGRLTLVVTTPLVPKMLDQIRTQVASLAPWVDQVTPIASPEDVFDESLGNPEAGSYEFITSEVFTGFVRIVERRIVGSDWLRAPQVAINRAPPVIVFASHKGGVGRSTALAVAAAALSRDGLNLLVIDLDLEAPGVGSMLLKNTPRFGALDYYVETGLMDVGKNLLDDLIASSEFAENGLVHVVPAVGQSSIDNPQNVLGKIARAYLERADSDGTTSSFLDRTRSLVTDLCERTRYDAVFVDARAGLNEGTAAAILGLGAEILLFGVDTPQTFSGYRFLLAHLQRFRPSQSDEDDWRYRLRMVQAKAQADPKAQANFRTRSFEVFSDTLYDSEEGIDEDAFNFDYEDISAPHYAWPILNDLQYAEFDPFVRSDQFSLHVYDRTFGAFITALRDRIGRGT